MTLLFLVVGLPSLIAPKQTQVFPILPVHTEMVNPIHTSTFDKGGKAKVRKQGGNPRMLNGNLVFEGSQDGNLQVDPQIAVGGGYVMHGTNSGIIFYDKQGNYVQGVPQTEFNNGIDPKLFYDVNNHVFGFDMWVYWDKEKIKPVNISVSETSDPKGAWNTYPVPAPNGVDGGAVGESREWIGYSYPGGSEGTFVMRSDAVRKGKPATVYHFAGSLGEPVHTQDKTDDLYFLSLTDTEVVITRVVDKGDGTPVVASVVRKPHDLQYMDYPPAAPQKGNDKRSAAGDRNPKNVVLQNRCLWFCQTVNINGRAAVQWHQMTVNGTFVQSGRIADPVNSFIQSTLAVNRHGDVLLGFQESGPAMYISPRCALHKASDQPGKTETIIHLGEGVGPVIGGPWGDYSATVADGDNLKDLWTIQSIANEKQRGSTVIAKITP